MFANTLFFLGVFMLDDDLDVLFEELNEEISEHEGWVRVPDTTYQFDDNGINDEDYDGQF